MVYKFRITIDIELDPSINVHLHYGTMIIFKECGAGIYYSDTTNEASNSDQNTDYTFFNTLESNKSFFRRK